MRDQTRILKYRAVAKHVVAAIYFAIKTPHVGVIIPSPPTHKTAKDISKVNKTPRDTAARLWLLSPHCGPVSVIVAAVVKAPPGLMLIFSVGVTACGRGGGEAVAMS